MERVIVVGAGVIGQSIAWKAAKKGMSVTLVDPNPGHGASWVAAGMLAPITEADFGEESLTKLLMTGLSMWPKFAKDLEESSQRDPGYLECGTLLVAYDASDAEVLSRQLAYRSGLGHFCESLTARQCRSLLPSLSPNICGGAHIPSDHQVDNRRLIQALSKACAATGVVLRKDSLVKLEVNDNRPLCHFASSTSLGADAVVLATGAETQKLGQNEVITKHFVPPIRPVKGHILRVQLTPFTPLMKMNLRGIVRGHSTYLVSRNDRTVVIGASSEEMGFDASVNLGSVFQLLEDARLILPALDEMSLLETAVGFRPGSPDNAPYVGWSNMANVAFATGHYRNGILLAPLTADAIVALLLGGTLPTTLLPFPSSRGL